MQPFDRDRYDKLYKQVFKPAIEKARLDSYRVDNDPAASIPIETIQEEITNSVVCFAEITEDNPNVWFELGFAISRQKPLALSAQRSAPTSHSTCSIATSFRIRRSRCRRTMPNCKGKSRIA